MDGVKTFKELRNGMQDNQLNEGSGVITNTIAMKLYGDVRRLEKSIRGQSSLEKKIDLMATQNTKLAGLDEISIAVSGKAKGKLNKGSRLLSVIKSLK